VDRKQNEENSLSMNISAEIYFGQAIIAREYSELSHIKNSLLHTGSRFIDNLI
jgi:hypothetical protein